MEFFTYLKGTLGGGSVFGAASGTDCVAIGSVDLDFGGDLIRVKSMTDYNFPLAGGLTLLQVDAST